MPVDSLDELHPHHLALARSGSILQVGPALVRLLPELRPGDPVDRFFSFRQALPDPATSLGTTEMELPVQTAPSIALAELPLHDGFEIQARAIGSRRHLKLRYRVHYRERSQEIWLIDTNVQKVAAQTAAARAPTNPGNPSTIGSPAVSTSDPAYFRALASMASGLSHELNNLWMGTLGNTELLGLSIANPSPRQESMLDSMRNNADRAAELCDQLLLFAGNDLASLEAIDAGRFLDTLSIGAEDQILDPTITVHIEMQRPGPMLFGNAEKLRLLIGELVRNAVEASSPGTTVTVRLSETEDCVPCLEVIDQGHGMSQAILDRALDPFFSTRFLGRGLGLSTVLGITRAHGGSLRVESQPGAGTRVRVYLPQKREVAASLAPAASIEGA